MLVVAAAIAYRVFSTSPPPPEMTTESLAQPELPSATTSVDTAIEERAVPSAAAAMEAEPDCLPVDELNRHPLVLKLQSQADTAATDGIDIEKFRGIDDATVRGYADQGDSAAMVVVGAMSVMRAFRVDTSRAVDWLANGGALDGVVMEQQEMSPDAGLALNDAAYWFYQAALHGKVFALRHYGQVRDQLFGGPVGLGWIEQQDYDALERDQQLVLSPARIYGSAAAAMRPVPDENVSRTPVSKSPVSEIAERVLFDIRSNFDDSIADAALPQPTTSSSDVAEYERLMSQVCISEPAPR